ncbi:uncharacterized protein JCM6883_005378 [Sporobolomyces salmoneus]|uniref:uncharacterized protein n=1 Tax=Sporobolomyces salmoneus TaxID=183962 RepID=UPI00317439D7
MLARSSLLTARAALRQAPANPAMRRGLHVDNVINNTTPFDQTNGAKLGFYMVSFFGFGFAAPFLASAFQIWKASA